MSRRVKIVLISMMTALSGASFAMSAVTLAGFGSNALISQTVSSSGRLPSLLYLNPGVWDVDNPVYIMHVWQNSNDSNSANVSGKKAASNGYYVFEFEDAKSYDRIIFYRCRTETVYSSFDARHRDNNEGDIWNQTVTITTTSNNTLYTINSFGSTWNGSTCSTSTYNPS